MRASEQVRDRMRELDARIDAAARRVVHETDGEAVHDLRVALRRLRVLLQLARPLYGRFHADAVREAFTRVHRATGNLRDEEALQETLHLSDGMQHPRLVAWRGERARRRRDEVIALLRSDELPAARRLLEALFTLPVQPSRDSDLKNFAQHQLKKACRRVTRKQHHVSHEPASLHALRIACKKLRYTIELLEDGLSRDERALAEPAARLQRELGHVHDIDVAMAELAHSSLPKRLRAAVSESLGRRRDDILRDDALQARFRA